MNLHIVTMIFGTTDRVVFCGLSRTFDGAVNVLRTVLPKKSNLSKLTWSPTGTLWRWNDHPSVYIRIEVMKRLSFKGNTGWVVTKRNEGQMTESIFAVFDDKDRAFDFVNRMVDEPVYAFRKKCKITEVDGYKPFSKIIGDENPELNRVHFSIYETEIEK